MKKSIISCCLIFSSLLSLAQKDGIAEQYGQTITPRDLSRHLHILASDSMEGRETGYKGQKMAARYLAEQFKLDGLEPVVKTDSGLSYFQKFGLVKKEWGNVTLSFKKKEKTWLQDFYAYGDVSTEETQKMKVVFLGYGIDSEKYSDYYNEFAGQKNAQPLNLKGKAVIIFMGEPVINKISLVSGDSIISDWANDWRRKAATAKAKGASQVFIVVGKTDDDFNKRLAVLKPHLGAPTLGFTHKQRGGSAFFIPISLAAEMLNLKPDYFPKILELRAKNLTTFKTKFPYPATPTGVIIKVNVPVKKTPVSTENVLGYIEGSDKKEELIILTAHYDHIGKEGDKIYYGADDDGSGTAALLELAEAFGKAKKEGNGPRRSILIMPVTAEEKGLMGSEYYTDRPVFPLKNTIADLNIDMIGRLDSAHLRNADYVYLIGSDKLSSQLHTISEETNKMYTKLQLDYTFNRPDDPNRFYYRSDHYNFAK
ncbi:MAG: M28 family peptidase, partial [Cytophagaceae bacterium]